MIEDNQKKNYTKNDRKPPITTMTTLISQDSQTSPKDTRQYQKHSPQTKNEPHYPTHVDPKRRDF